MINFAAIEAEVTLRLGNRQDISARIARWINYAYFEILLSPRFSFKEIDLVTTFNTVANTQSYSLATIASDWWFVHDLRDNTNFRRIRQIHWQTIDDIQQTMGQVTRYALYGEQILLDPIPDAIYNVQLRYRRRPPDLDGVVTQDVMGTEWEEPMVMLSTLKGFEALQQPEQAQVYRASVEGLFAIRQDVPMLEDEDSDTGLVPSLIFRQQA